MEKIEILYKDDYFIAVNKPSGLLTIQDGYKPELPNLKSILANQFNKVYTVHRIDKETSGLLIFALTSESHRKFSLVFEQRKLKKEYRALVSSELPKEALTIDLPLRVNGDRRHRTIVDPQRGKPAITVITFIRKYNSATVISASPQTGYTHQIRAHLAAIDCPIINDPLYNPQSIDSEHFPPRLLLHSYKITLLHPFTQQTIEIIAPLPPGLHFLE